jgi:methyl-accepting chemotaxis protein
LKQQKQIELQHATEIAVSIAKDEHAAAQKGELSAAEAQKRAQARIGAIRYGDNDYFWINDMQVRMVMHPTKPDMNGKSTADFKDPNGKALFVEAVDVVRRNGAGFVAYEWPKPGSDKPQPKLSHVAGFAPWDCVIGTGIYVDDLDAQVWTSTRRSLIAASLVFAIVLAVSIVMARRITGPLHRMTAAMKELAAGKLDVEVPGVGNRDEIGEMADAVEVFKTNAVARLRLEAEQKEAEAGAAVKRRADMRHLADQFEATVGSS